MKYTYRTGIQKFKTKLINVSTAMVVAFTGMTGAAPLFVTGTAHAAGAISITSPEELCSAIKNQADDQIWNIAPGSYGIGPDVCPGITAVNGNTNKYLPLTANNLVVNGIGNPTIYGQGFTTNGNGGFDGDFVAVTGNHVTIKNLTLMTKIYPNKAVEIRGADSVLENVSVKPNTKSPSDINPTYYPEWSELYAGAIYYQNSAGTHTLKNVTVTNGGISLRSADATFNLDNVKLYYRTNDDFLNTYRVYKPYERTKVNGTPAYIYQVSNSLNNISSVLSAINDPSTVAGSENIQLISDLYASSQININKPNVTIDGKKASGSQYYTIFGSFDKTSNSNNSVLSVTANGVRINELNVDGQGHQLHGINTYEAKDLQMWRVATRNNGFSGLNVNRSWVQAVDLTTENNGWSGVDVDKQGAIFQSAGINQHSEPAYNHGRPVPHLYVDDRNVGQVNDTNDQYVYVDDYTSRGDRAYFLKSQVQPVTNLNIKYQYDSTSLVDGATVNKTAKPGNNNLVLNFDKPNSPAAIDHYITTETRPDGTSEDIWNGYNNTWLTAGKNSVGTKDSKAEFGYHGDGLYAYTVTVYYKNGTRATSSPITLVYDTHSPVVALTNPSGSSAKGQDQYTVTGTVTDSNFGSALFTVLDSQGKEVAHQTATAGTTNGNVTNVSATFDTTSWKNGRYTVELTATDAASNTSNVASNPVTINNDAQSEPFTGNATTVGRGAGPQGSAPQVQGAATTAALQSTATPTTDKGNVKGDSTEKANNIALATDTKANDTVKNSSAFLGLGWWWLVVLAAVAGLVAFLFRRADTNATN